MQIALGGAGTYSVAVVVVGTNLVETTDVIVFVVVVVGTLFSVFANAVSVDNMIFNEGKESYSVVVVVVGTKLGNGAKRTISFSFLTVNRFQLYVLSC